MQNADLQLTSDAVLDDIAVEKMVIQVDSERRWLYIAVDPETNEFLHSRLFPTRTTQLIVLFLESFNKLCRASKQRF